MTGQIQTEYHAITPSPVGRLILICTNQGLSQLVFADHTLAISTAKKVTEHPVLEQAKTELSEYFLGQRMNFSVPLNLTGSAFELSAWRALKTIPYGETVSYRQQATKMGYPLAARAVGRANGQNPLPIVIPCHRVITANGKIGGYIGGTAIKSKLLELEKHYAP